MAEPDPNQKAALKDANLLTQLSFGFAALGIISLILPADFLGGGKNQFEPKQVMAVVFFTASIVLGIWAFIRLRKGPRPFTGGYQLLIGTIYGMSLWLLPALASAGSPASVAFFPVLLIFIFVGARLISVDVGGGAMIAGGMMGCLLPILILFGICAFLR